MLKKVLITCWLLFGFGWSGYAQEINFGEYGDYGLSVEELNTNNLDFGTVVSGSNNSSSIPITEAKIIEITGVKYLDVFVEVQATPDLYLNGDESYSGDAQKSIPLTLKVAYANNLGTPTVSNAKIISIANNSFTTRFPVLERQNQPPGPPPPPPTSAFEQSQVEETAYLYFYGSITVGNVDAGSYSTELIVNISYE